MKKILPIIIASLFLVACSDDDLRREENMGSFDLNTSDAETVDISTHPLDNNDTLSSIETSAIDEPAEKYEGSISEQITLMPIKYTFQKHSCYIGDSGNDNVSADYFTIKLDSEYEEMYEELQKVLDGYGRAGRTQVKEFFESNIGDSSNISDKSFCLMERKFIPVRADERVLSFMTIDFTYYGGPHGLTDYSSYNYDPITGKEILITDVVKDINKLPDIIMSLTPL